MTCPHDVSAWHVGARPGLLSSDVMRSRPTRRRIAIARWMMLAAWLGFMLQPVQARGYREVRSVAVPYCHAGHAGHAGQARRLGSGIGGDRSGTRLTFVVYHPGTAGGDQPALPPALARPQIARPASVAPFGSPIRGMARDTLRVARARAPPAPATSRTHAIAFR